MTNVPSEYEAHPVTGYEAPDYSSRDDFGATAPSASMPPATPATWPPSESSSTTNVAKDEAGKVKDTAVDAGKQVAATAKDEAANVAAETKQQAKSLFGAVTSEVQIAGRLAAAEDRVEPARAVERAGRHGLGFLGVRSVDRSGTRRRSPRWRDRELVGESRAAGRAARGASVRAAVARSCSWRCAVPPVCWPAG